MKIQVTLDLTIEDDANPDALVEELIEVLNDEEYFIRRVNSVDDGQWKLSDNQWPG